MVDGDRPVVPIGSPVWNSSGYVLDDRMRPVPDGVPGELYLSGRQVARGYVGRADLTADRFVADPFVGGARMYRTGDVVRRNRSGGLEYIGRSDFQVKLRGLRIELGEIESVLRRDPQVSSAAVVVWRDRLVAYVAGTDVHVDSVRRAVASTLPSYMVPDSVVVLESLPLNASGKLDRRALPEPVSETREFREPVSLAEQAVASVFAEVLGVEQVGLDDDFFALGGNSLIATQVVSRVGVVVDAKIPVRTLFESSTVESFAAAVEGLAGSGGALPLVPQDRPDRIPLSFAQQRMWFLNQFDTSSSAYNLPLAVRLTGELDTDALSAAVNDVLERHESLRTRYPSTDEGPVQVIVPASQVVLDLEPIDVVESELLDRAGELVRTGFDVAAGVPIRAGLFRVGPGDFALVLVVHHICGDGSSIAPMARDVMVAYEARSRGEQPAWEMLPVQYVDYTLWQRRTLGSHDDRDSLARHQLDYWKRRLAGVPDVLELPTDHPRPASQTFRGATVTFDVPRELHAALGEIAHEHQATLFMVVHASVAVLLARLSGGDDIAVGSPTAGRGDRALDDLIGMFVNTLVLRTRVEPNTSFADLLDHVRSVDVEAFEHADVPFELVVDTLDPVRSTAALTVVPSLARVPELHAGSVRTSGPHTVCGRRRSEHAAEVRPAIDSRERFDDLGAPDGIAATFTYAPDLFDETTVETLAARLSESSKRLRPRPTARSATSSSSTTPNVTRWYDAWNATDTTFDGCHAGVLVRSSGARISGRDRGVLRRECIDLPGVRVASQSPCTTPDPIRGQAPNQ